MTEVESYGPVTALRQGRRLLGLLPPIMNVRCYAVDGLLIDAGLASLRAQVLDFARAHRVARAVITHHHEDHSGNAGALTRERIPVVASAGTASLLRRGFSLRLYQHLLWGRAPRTEVDLAGPTLATEHHRFQILPAPGHCDDQVVLFEPTQGWLFSGDAFLASRIKYFRADEDFAQTLASLRRLADLPFDALFCAHRPVLRGGKAALRQKLDQLVSLQQQVLALHARGLPLREISRQVLGPEDPFFFLLTGGDVSKRNLVRAILHGPVPRRS